MKLDKIIRFHDYSGQILENAYKDGKVNIRDYDREKFLFLVKNEFLSPTLSMQSQNFVGEWYTLSEKGYRLLFGEIRLRRRWIVTTILSVIGIISGFVSLAMQLIQ